MSAAGLSPSIKNSAQKESHVPPATRSMGNLRRLLGVSDTAVVSSNRWVSVDSASGVLGRGIRRSNDGRAVCARCIQHPEGNLAYPAPVRFDHHQYAASPAYGLVLLLLCRQWQGIPPALRTFPAAEQGLPVNHGHQPISDCHGPVCRAAPCMPRTRTARQTPRRHRGAAFRVKQST